MWDNLKVGVGILTYERPEFYIKCANSIAEHLHGVVDTFVGFDNGSKSSMIRHLPTSLIACHGSSRRNVAYGKNQLLKFMMAEDCDVLFVCEDDMEIHSINAVVQYIKAYQQTGVEHLNYAHHGDANVSTGPVNMWKGLELYSACIGAWSFFTHNVIDKVGYFDERFENAYEHVEHTSRIAHAGLTAPFWSFPDVPGSQNWITPQNGAIETSQLRTDGPTWLKNNAEMLQLWQEIDPEVWQ